MFLVHGTADEIVSIEGSRTFVQNSNNSNLEYMEYEGGYHELFNDTMKEKVLGDILDWLDKIAILSFSILACLIEHFHI
jgi:alpha-beta hydrolase superfamily lysophospholipase